MEDTQETTNPSSGKLGYGPFSAVMVTVGIYFLAQLFTGAVLTTVFLLQGRSLNDLRQASPALQFLIILLVEAFTLGMLGLFLRYRRTRLGLLGLVKPQVRDVGYILGGYTIYFVIFLLLTQVVSKVAPGVDLRQEQDIGFDKATTGDTLWLIFVSLVILPPVTEEVLMRGFLYTGLRSRLKPLLAGVLTSVLFASAHLLGGTDGQLIWVAALDTFVLSMILVYVREETGSLWPSIGIHMIKNGLAFAVLFIFKVP